jgi:hypothetical protein
MCYYVHFRSGTEGGAFCWLLEVRALLILILILVQWRTGSWENHRRRLRRTWWWVKSWNAKPFLIIFLPLFQSLTLNADRWCGMCAISCRCHRISMWSLFYFVRGVNYFCMELASDTVFGICRRIWISDTSLFVKYLLLSRIEIRRKQWNFVFLRNLQACYNVWKSSSIDPILSNINNILPRTQ